MCDITGKMVEPWIDNGYRAVLVDPQHEHSSDNGRVEKIKATVLEAMSRIGQIIRTERVVFVAGFPPCTDVATSGSRWFSEKAKSDPHFQAKAALVAEQCRTVGKLAGCPWLFENPVSVFSSIFGKPDFTFHPHHFSGYCLNDNYNKTTCLWAGGGFMMPQPYRDPFLGEPDDRIHRAVPGPDRANFRSATPVGFARAVYLANAPHLKEGQQ